MYNVPKVYNLEPNALVVLNEVVAEEAEQLLPAIESEEMNSDDENLFEIGNFDFGSYSGEISEDEDQDIFEVPI